MAKRWLTIILILITVSAFIPLPNLTHFVSAATPSVGPNIDIAGELGVDRQRVEPTITVDPHNPNVIATGAQDLSLKGLGGHRWHGLYRSSDGGKSWSASLLPGYPGDTSSAGSSSPLQRWNATTDATLAFDRNGNLYYAGGALVISGTTVTTSSPTLFVAKYTNDGSTYSGVTIVSGSSDKQWITVDNTGGQYDGRVYLVMDNSVGGTVVFTYSSDGGASFANTVAVGGRHGGLAVAPDGTVYIVTWNNANLLEISKSIDGGATVQTNMSSIPITPLPSPLPGGNFRTGNNPQIASDSRGVYVTWGDYGTGTAQVRFAKSSDAGNTWSAPITVNDVSAGQHFFPVISAYNGTIGIAWYDSRLNAGSSLSTLDLYYAQSSDAGATFSPNLRISNSSFDPGAVERTDAPTNNSPFLGDYIDIAAGASGIFPIWADNRNACDVTDPTFGCVDQDIYTAAIGLCPCSAPPPPPPSSCPICNLAQRAWTGWWLIWSAIGLTILSFSSVFFLGRRRRSKSSGDASQASD